MLVRLQRCVAAYTLEPYNTSLILHTVHNVYQPLKLSKQNAVADDVPDHWESRLGMPDQQIADIFRARQMTQAYQEMFVRGSLLVILFLVY